LLVVGGGVLVGWEFADAAAFAATTSENIVDAAAPFESRTVAVNAYVPLFGAAPVITPVAGFSVNPAGNAPPVVTHVYGGIPPVTFNFAA